MDEKMRTLNLDLAMQGLSFSTFSVPISDVRIFMHISPLAPWGLVFMSFCTRAPWTIYETTLTARFTLSEILQRQFHLFFKIQVFKRVITSFQKKLNFG